MLLSYGLEAQAGRPASADFALGHSGGSILQARAGFAVIYRMRLHSGKERQFVEAWSTLTKRLRAERGGLGSRLHRGPEGVWYAYAQWPSAAAREQAFAQGPIDPEAEQSMREAVAEQLPEIALDPVEDLLLIPGSGPA